MSLITLGAKAKPKFTPKAPPKKEIVEPVAAPVVAARYVNSCANLHPESTDYTGKKLYWMREDVICLLLTQFHIMCKIGFNERSRVSCTLWIYYFENLLS
jgi:hypothetical protein